MSQTTLRRLLPEIAFFAYQAVLGSLTLTVILRLVFEYHWGQCALYGIATTASYYLGQGIVAVMQHSRRSRQGIISSENDF